MQRQKKHFYEFGKFRIDTRERQLLREGKPISVTPKTFDLLLLLVENNGHTLAKEEVMLNVWPGTFVEENNLSRNISMLRKLLGDNFHDSGFIKTIPKRGYRFETDVHEVLEDVEELVVERRSRYTLAVSGTWRSPWRILTLSAMALAILTLAAWATGWWQEGVRSSATTGGGRGTSNAGAFELYKRGRELWQNRSAAGLHEATILLEQAVEKDPSFAIGYAALADAYAFDVGKWHMTEATANKAIELDPTLGEPHASIGFVKFFWEWKPAEAEMRFKKAVTLSPDYATGHQWYAIRFAANGQFNQALAEMNRAFELEPTSIAVNADMCQLLYFVGRYDDAETQCNKALEIDPNSFNTRRYLYQVYTAKGMYREAVDEFLKSEGLSVNHSALPAHLEKLKAAFGSGGILAFWREQIDILNRPVPDTGYTTAWYYALLGDKDKTFLCLRRSYETRDFGFVLFAADPVFSQFFDDPRFQELKEKLFMYENNGGS